MATGSRNVGTNPTPAAPVGSARWTAARYWPGGQRPLLDPQGIAPVLLSGSARPGAGALQDGPLSTSAAIVDPAMVNLVPNPSFEVDTVGWTATGDATISRVSAASAGIPALFGDYVLLVEPQGDTSGAEIPLTLSASTTYACAAYVYATGAQGYSLSLTDKIDQGLTTNIGTQPTNDWRRLEMSGTTDTHAGRWLQFESAGAFYLDAVQVEAGAGSTSYADGSIGAGHTWDGAVHASTTSRDAGRGVCTLPALDTSTGAVLCWWRPTPGSAVTGDDRVLLSWNDGQASVDVRYRPSTGLLRLRIERAPGIGDTVEVAPSPFSAGDAVLVVAEWTPATLGIGTHDRPVMRAARLTPPTALTQTTLDLGSAAGSEQAMGAVGPVWWLPEPPSPNTVRRIARHVTPPATIGALGGLLA